MSTQQKSITRILNLIPHVLGQTMSALILDSFPLALPKDVVMWLAHNRGHGKTDFKRPILSSVSRSCRVYAPHFSDTSGKLAQNKESHVAFPKPETRHETGTKSL